MGRASKAERNCLQKASSDIVGRPMSSYIGLERVTCKFYSRATAGCSFAIYCVAAELRLRRRVGEKSDYRERGEYQALYGSLLCNLNVLYISAIISSCCQETGDDALVLRDCMSRRRQV